MIAAVILISLLLQNSAIKNQIIMPLAIPVEIDEESIIIIIVKKAGVACVKLTQFTFSTCCIMIIPIKTKAGDITSIGIAFISGDKNKET